MPAAGPLRSRLDARRHGSEMLLHWLCISCQFIVNAVREALSWPNPTVSRLRTATPRPSSTARSRAAFGGETLRGMKRAEAFEPLAIPTPEHASGLLFDLCVSHRRRFGV